MSLLPELFEAEVSYDDPPTRKERLLISEPGDAIEIMEENMEIESDEDDDDSDDESVEEDKL